MCSSSCTGKQKEKSISLQKNQIISLCGREGDQKVETFSGSLFPYKDSGVKRGFYRL